MSIIMIIDDNAVNLKLARGALSGEYEVMPFTSGVQAIKALERSSRRPHLILLDIEMPEMDGFEVLAVLKADDRFCDIPIIFLTANDGSDIERRGIELGAVDYLTKPFSSEALKKRIELHLGAD